MPGLRGPAATGAANGLIPASSPPARMMPPVKSGLAHLFKAPRAGDLGTYGVQVRWPLPAARPYLHTKFERTDGQESWCRETFG